MSSQHFFIEGQYYGEASRSPYILVGELHTPQSFAFCCPTCGEIWARAHIADRPFYFFTKPCRKHTAPCCRIPGSLWLPLEEAFTAALPPEVVAWEFSRHLDYLESTL